VSTAWDAADLATLRQLYEFGETLGVEAEMLGARDLRALEPALAPGPAGGLYAAGDHEVDPRMLHAALLAAADLVGARFVRAAARLRTTNAGTMIVDLDDGSSLDAGTVVVAAGAWSGVLDGLTPAARPPVRPVKGQTLLLRPDRPLIGRVVRASIKGAPVYLVPRRNGDVVVGASVEEAGFDIRPRAGAVYDLLRDAQTALPELGEAQLVEVNTGLRPGSPDNSPLIGPSSTPGLIFATGHYRNGILLTPITADAVTTYIVEGAVPDDVLPFSPGRFAEAIPA
jgi:glycine oxidase